MDPLIERKQLLIGLDAMDWHMVQRWAAENKMPTFRRLMEQGTQVELSTVADTLPDTLWNCICSGLNPGHLARYFYVQHDPETAGLRYMPDDSPRGKLFLGSSERRRPPRRRSRCAAR